MLEEAYRYQLTPISVITSYIFQATFFKVANSDISFQSNTAFKQESKDVTTARFRTHQPSTALRSQRCCQASF